MGAATTSAPRTRLTGKCDARRWASTRDVDELQAGGPADLEARLSEEVRGAFHSSEARAKRKAGGSPQAPLEGRGTLAGNSRRRGECRRRQGELPHLPL
jgi:hypothetical protein